MPGQEDIEVTCESLGGMTIIRYFDHFFNITSLTMSTKDFFLMRLYLNAFLEFIICMILPLRR